MSRPLMLAAAVALGLFGSVAVRSTFAEDKPALPPREEKAAEKEKAPAKGPRLTGFWAKLTGLTDEQKSKLAAIHKKALADKRDIEEQEEKDSVALLTDDQKKEYAKLEEEESAKRKETAAKKKTDEGGEKKAEEKKSDEKK